MEKTKTTLSTPTNLSETPRIKPIENPKSIKLKLAYWFTKKKLGKVVTPMKVGVARMPNTLSLSQKLVSIEENLSLPRDLVFYIKTYVATLNGCSFCIDIGKAMAEDEVAIQKYNLLLQYESSDAFDETEKAAIKYVEQATIEKDVSDEVFTELQRHYSDTEIVEITWLNALENYYNLLNKPLKIGSDNLCAL